MTNRVTNYYTYSLSNNVSELGPNEFSRAKYFTIHLIRARSSDLELDTIYFDEYANSPASVKREFVEQIILTLNADLEIKREAQRKPAKKKPVKKKPTKKLTPKPEKKKPTPKPEKKKPTPKPEKKKPEVIEPVEEILKRKPIRHEFDLKTGTTKQSLVEKIRRNIKGTTFKAFSVDYVKESKTGFRKITKIENATHVRLWFGDDTEGYREINTFDIPKKHRGTFDGVEEFASDVIIFNRNELNETLNFYGTRYFSPNEEILINDVVDYNEYVVIDLYKTFADKQGKEYFVRKFYLFYVNGVEISNPNAKRVDELAYIYLQVKKKLLNDFKLLCDYAYERRMTSSFIYRCLYSMDTYRNNDDVFVAQGVGIGRQLTDRTKKQMYSSASRCLDAILAEGKNTKYLERYKNIKCDGFTIENDSRDLSELEQLGAFKIY
jgi:hypothetical protein